MEKVQELKFWKMEQRSKEWHDVRLGKMTGSKLKDIIDIKKRGLLKGKDAITTALSDVISELTTGFSNDSDFINDAMQWGIDHENEVIDRIKTDKCYQVGGVTNNFYKYFWLSPDLLESHNKAFEIKCPTSKTFIKCLINGKIPSEHLVQCLAYFVTMPSLEVLDFVMYDPRQKHIDMIRIPMKREDYADFICNISDSLLTFCNLIDDTLNSINENVGNEIVIN